MPPFHQVACRHRLARHLTPLICWSGFAVAWGYFIATFGWAGALLGCWPAAVIGGGGALALLHAIELTRPLHAMSYEVAQKISRAGEHSY